MQQQLLKLFEMMRRQSGLAVLPFNQGCSVDEIARLERDLGVSLPSDYAHFLGRHNGQADPFTVRFPPDQVSFLSDREIVTLWNELNEPLASEAPEAVTHGRVRDVLQHRRRIPIAYNEAGGASLCLDFIPGPEGREGQVLFNVNEVEWVVIEETFSELIARYLKFLESGEVRFERQPPEYGDGYWFSASGRYLDWALYEQLKASIG